MVVGDNNSRTYQQLIETADELDQLVTLFDGSASLVTGDFRDLVREQLCPPPDKEVTPDRHRGDPPMMRRRNGLGHLTKGIRYRFPLAGWPGCASTLQEHDAGARVNVTIQVESDAGIPRDALGAHRGGLDQLGIQLNLEEA